MNHANELISGFRRGTLQSVRELYRTHYSSLLYFSERIVRDRQVAREIVFETFIKLFNRRNHLENAADIKAFLFITARNTCMDYLRFAKNVRQAEAQAAELIEFDLSNEAAIAEANHLLTTAIEKMPAFNQQVFRILFTEGMQVSAAARQLDMDPRELLNCRKDIIRQLQMLLLEHQLFSTPFFIHFLAVASRQHAPAAMPIPVNR